MSRPTILITGASSGIGRECARLLVREDFDVFATVRREKDRRALEDELGERVRAVALDVGSAESVTAARDQVVEILGGGGLDGLVNNAGINVRGALETLPPEQLSQQLEINLLGVLRVTQAFLPALRRARGRIVNIGSISGRVAFPGLGAYSASKFALAALNDTLRLELEPWKLAVILVEPGAMRTPLWARAHEHAEQMQANLPAASRALYARLHQRSQQAAAAAELRAADPVAVARTVLRALTARRPRPRYLVGRDAHRLALVTRWLPERWRDRLLLRRMGLHDLAPRDPGTDIPESRRLP